MQVHMLSFEGPDAYAQAGGLATRVTGLAAALAGRVPTAGLRVGVILSGGNVDLAAAAELFRTDPEP